MLCLPELNFWCSVFPHSTVAKLVCFVVRTKAEKTEILGLRPPNFVVVAAVVVVAHLRLCKIL